MKKKKHLSNVGKPKAQRAKKPRRGQESPVYTGNKSTEAVTLTAVSFDGDRYVDHQGTAANIEALQKDFFGTTWINLNGVHDTALVQRVGKLFGIHSMIIEDVLNVTRRPRTDVYDDQTFVVCNLLSLEASDGSLRREQVSFVMKPNLLLTFQEDAIDDFDLLRERIQRTTGQLRRLGADYLLYTLMDSVIDRYFQVLEAVGDRIEEIEDTLIAYPNTDHLSQIYAMKNEIILLRKYTWPMREVIARLERSEDSVVQDSSKPYFRDLYDHIVEVMEMLDTFREMIYGMVDIYMSSASNRMNQIMKVLTIISTLFIPLTFIAGVYGMNFEYMPELKLTYGYPAVIGFMIAVAVGMMLYVKRMRWV